MDVYTAYILTILYWIFYPIYSLLYYILLALLYIVTPILKVLLFILQPLFYFVRLLADCVTGPFYFLARFETIYIYLGVAALSGIAAALILHFFSDFLYSSLSLYGEPGVNGPNAKQYRASRANKAKAQADRHVMLSPPLLKRSISDIQGKARSGLLAQTIHEEDSDF